MFGFLGVLGAVGALWERVGARGSGRFLRAEMTSSFFFKRNILFGTLFIITIRAAFL